ncbi:sensor histidine kinase [Bifidobacterium leontopitheci]|nr:ATP-binding protein [Bifidobacterium leontopitheci]
MPEPSLWIFVVFLLLALAVLVWVGFLLFDRLQPVIVRMWNGSMLVRTLSARLASMRRKSHDDDDDGDDLDDRTQVLLSMLPLASIVVGDNDEVLRANPASYRLGLVRDEAIVDDRVLQAVRAVMADGSRRSFDLMTDTPEQYAGLGEPGAGFGVKSGSLAGAAVPPSRPDGDAAHGGEDDGRRDVEGAGSRPLSRPNWLKVTVGRIDRHLVVVLIDDVSESIRFAQIRDSFISNVSEQLLQPTKALEQLADSLEQPGVSEAQVRDDAGKVRHACTKLNRMVSDLLMLIKAQEPVTASAANRCPLYDQVTSAVDGLGPLADRCGVTVRVGGDAAVMVHGEDDQLRLAVRKLVENAILYSPRGGAVGVSVSRSADGGRAMVRVIDHGVGVSKKELPRIFERFYRGTNQSERTEDGIGLGLAIVKHVALAHHGDVTVWSAPGQGCTFTFSLPCDDAAPVS